MLIRAGFEIVYNCPAPTPILTLLSVHPSRRADLETPDDLMVNGEPIERQFLDQYGNLCGRTMAPAGRVTLTSDFTIRDNGLPDPAAPWATQAPVETLPDDVLIHLRGSRYCETDRMSDLAWRLFGWTNPGWERVQAIVDYAHNQIAFGYQHARATKTAWEAHEEGLGVCRDYAHLAITLCRCMNIPARYCTGYLGDIGIPPVDAPMDFSAWFEVYLGGAWHTFDARHNTPRIGRIVIARGQDAADVAITHSFGSAQLISFNVVTDEVPEPKTLSRAQRSFAPMAASAG
jgi:transglutaminase-like putative cysteine protease